MKTLSCLSLQYFFAISFFTVRAVCVTINPSPGLVVPINDTDLPHRTIAGQLGKPDCYCTESPRWLGRGTDRLACNGAVTRFFNDEVKRHGYIDYEFEAQNATPTVHDRPELTPRRYEMGMCLLLQRSRRKTLNLQGPAS